MYQNKLISLFHITPFGSAINTRSYSSGAYRYGFNGKELDKESFNDAYDFGARIYDGRLGRWFRVDNKFYLFAHQSPYSYALNTPIIVVDANGEYPKPSEVLASMGFEPPPLAAGLMDGFVSGLGILDACEFAYNLATDAKFRDQMIETFSAIASDPLGFANSIANDYKTKFKKIGSGSEEGQYLLGEMIGELAGGVLTGAASYKLYKLAKNFQKGKLAKQANNAPKIPNYPKKNDIFTNDIGTRHLAEDYATQTKYKDYKNMNVKDPNNPGSGPNHQRYDLKDAAGNVVDVTTTVNLTPSNLYNKINRLSEAKGVNGSRTVQVYLPGGKFSLEEIAKFKAKLIEYGSSLKNKVVIEVDVID